MNTNQRIKSKEISKHLDNNSPGEYSSKLKSCSLNQSIAILLRSYTQAINKQETTSGSLFRESTKAECVNCPKGITPSFITQSGITTIPDQATEKQYPKICFNYIHKNPVKAGFANDSIYWEYSSAKDYAGLRDGKLINKQLAKKFGLI